MIDESKLPPRLILSRKGTDSSAGGHSSIRVDKLLISLPIPEYSRSTPSVKRHPDHRKYGDLPSHPVVGEFIDLLPQVTASTAVHVDPDIRLELRPANSSQEFMIFGQEKAAQGHLANQGIGNDCLFLFFGWFQQSKFLGGAWHRFGPHQHVIWGWFQIRDSFPVTTAKEVEDLPWASHHPHVTHMKRYGKRNHLYRATERLSFAPHLPGAGVFPWKDAMCLTQICEPAEGRSEWCVPEFFQKAQLTYNTIGAIRCKSRPGYVHFTAAGRGQEFVSPRDRAFIPTERQALGRWLELLFDGI